MKPYRYFRLNIASALLLVLLVIVTAFRLEITDWTPDLGYTAILGVIGALLGFGLGYSIFEKTIRGLFVISYSITIIPLYLSGIIEGDVTELGRIISLLGRFSASLILWLNGKKVEDHVFFVILMSTLFWLIGVYCAFQLIRKREIFRIILPTFIPMLVIQYYDGSKPGRIWGLALYLFLALVLAGRINLAKSHELWENENVLAGDEPEFDINKNMVKIAAILVLIAFLIPLPSVLIPAAVNTWKKINDPFTSVQTKFDNLFAALKSERIRDEKGEIFGDILGLGRNAVKGETPLFKIVVDETYFPRQYWRMRVYDTYINSAWQVKKGRAAEFDPVKGSFSKSDTIISPESEFSIYWQTNPSSFMVTPQQTIWISRNSSIQVDGNIGSETDPFSWKTSPVLHNGDLYKVRALIFNPTQKMLRQSEPNYPKWIIQRYLQIPENIKTTIKPLAEKITFGLNNDFDKAEAITSYLRKTMSYSEVVSDPPSGEDPIIWFIMKNKIGFCNYYASADVLMLRSIGIPARLVVGFSQGIIDIEREYSVREKDSHAWPEVFFPGVGWVQFEPTTIQPEISRPLGLEPLQSIISGNPNKEAILDKNKASEKDADSVRVTNPTIIFLSLLFNKWKWPLLVCLIILGTIIMYRILLRNHEKRYIQLKIARSIKAMFIYLHFSSPVWLEHWIKWEQASPIERAFHSVNQSLNWMKKPQGMNITPAERASLVKTLIPGASEEIDRLNSSLESALFGNEIVNIKLAEQAGRNLRYKTIKKIIIERFFGV